MIIRINAISVVGLIQTKPWKSTVILWRSRCCCTNEYSIYLLVLLKYGLFNKIYFTFFSKHKFLISYSLNSFVSFEQGLRTLLITLFITGFDLEGFFIKNFMYFTEFWFEIAPFDRFALRWNLDVSHALKNPGQSTASHRIEPNKISAGKPRNKKIRFVSSKRIASNDVWSLVAPLLNCYLKCEIQ